MGAQKVGQMQMFAGEQNQKMDVKFSLESDQEAPEDEFEQIVDDDDEYN